ncbi:MAG TPA: hypothetical protein VG934_00250 [Candidatus Paceibacterota bacterium]|nr:hypothetical protein [Candidatus Paceibacterota bacterium]
MGSDILDRMPPSDVFTLLEDADKARTALLEQHRQELEAKGQNISNLIENLRRRINAGESTGDRLRDLVLSLYGFDALFEDSARAFERELAGKKGEFVLLHFQASTPFRHALTETTYHSNDYVRMGVLAGEHLIGAMGVGILASTEQITLPVHQYIQVAQIMMFEAEGIQVKPEKGNIFAAHWIQNAHPPELEKYLYAKRTEKAGALGLPSLFGPGHVDRRESRMREIVIGDELITKWLKEHHMMGLYKSAAIALSKLILEPTEG